MYCFFILFIFIVSLDRGYLPFRGGTASHATMHSHHRRLESHVSCVEKHFHDGVTVGYVDERDELRRKFDGSALMKAARKLKDEGLAVCVTGIGESLCS